MAGGHNTSAPPPLPRGPAHLATVSAQGCHHVAQAGARTRPTPYARVGGRSTFPFSSLWQFAKICLRRNSVEILLGSSWLCMREKEGGDAPGAGRRELPPAERRRRDRR